MAAAGPEYVVYPLCMLLAMLAVSTFTGLWPLDRDPYNSYALQACAWLNRRLDLGRDYTWLELAIYEGRYYVSFPPFPSLVLLPFAAVFGENTPDHLISIAFTIVGVVYALRLYALVTGSLRRAELLVPFLFLGNGYLFVAMRGWVWYMAQCMCFTLSLMALYYAASGRAERALMLWVWAAGCRPMAIVYLPLLAELLLARYRAAGGCMRPSALLKNAFSWALPAILMGTFYLTLNFARFHNPFEFGHNYLPEFTRAEHGQFSFSYIPANLRLLLGLPGVNGENGALDYTAYNCAPFYLAAPMAVCFIGSLVHAAVTKRRSTLPIRGLAFMLLAHLLIVCCHRTMGGFQFGDRYLVDMLPYLYFGLLVLRPEEERRELLNLPLYTLGLCVNLVGTVAAYNGWII